MNNNYKICTRCVMDNRGDDTIKFFEDGTCIYCNYALARKPKVYYPNEEGKKKLDRLIRKLKKEGKNHKYDCLMGISGGLDSSYLAYLGSIKWGLRILGVHVDDGFDSPATMTNIRNLCENCNIDLVNSEINKDQFNDLTRSFILAGVPNICIPQDNVLFAELFKTADRKKIRYFLSGTNFALESILQRGNMHNQADLFHIKAIHNEYGSVTINDLPLLSLFDRYLRYKYIKKLMFTRPLDWINYNKVQAVSELRKVGFDYYEGKHYESVLTRFMQVYYLPKKFGVDIRKSHLSSLIISEQMTREEALIEIQKPLHEKEQMADDIKYLIDRMNLTRVQFEMIMRAPPKKHSDYSHSWLIKLSPLARRFRKFLSD